MRGLKVACVIAASLGCGSAGGGGRAGNGGTGGSGGTSASAGSSGGAGNGGSSSGGAGNGGSASGGVGNGGSASGGAGNGGSASGGATGGGAVDASADAAPILFEEQTLAIAAEYISWGRVDDELRWAPGLCRQPLPGVAHASTSNDATTHGQKLYSLFAKNWANYPDGPQDGQAVVKQSWKVEAVTTPDASFNPGAVPAPNDAGDHFYPYAKGPDGGVFHATEPAGLFIMFKVDPTTPETDDGWVYATVSPDGQVTSGGRVASCMGCHETSATHERLFGVSKYPLAP